MSTYRRATNSVIHAVAACALGGMAALSTHAQTAAQQAQAILRETGITGGLIVHIGCTDGALTVALAEPHGFIVHALATQAGHVDATRRAASAAGLAHKVTVDRLNGATLPHTEHLVNLIVADQGTTVPADELMRVLAPNGVAYVKENNEWRSTVKPRPADMDDWGHYLHDPSNNCVSADRLVGPPRRMRWVAGPDFTRHHESMTSFSAMVSDGGRVFYIHDEGTRAGLPLPAKWFLVARDGYNGALLWKRAIDEWQSHTFGFKAGPAPIARRLVATDNKLYVALGLSEPLSVLDAATGTTLSTLPGTENAEEILVSGTQLFVVSIDPDSRTKMWETDTRTIQAFPSGGGNATWTKEYPVALLSLTVDNGKVYFHDGERVRALSRTNGNELWSSPPIALTSTADSWFGPTMLVDGGLIFFSGGADPLPKDNAGLSTLYAVSASDGSIVWHDDSPPVSGYHAPKDLFVVGEKLYTGDTHSNKNSTGEFRGYDITNGSVTSSFLPDVSTHWFHHRCYRAKATDRYALTSRKGVEFVDFAAQTWEIHHWVRGACSFGVLPANGLLYAPPDPCGCYPTAKLRGLTALAAQSGESSYVQSDPAGRRETGPALGAVTPATPYAQEWPTYRANQARSGATDEPISPRLSTVWRTALGGRLSGITVAENRVFVASVNRKTLYALNPYAGDTVYSYTAGGRIDSPPTVYKGMAIFGCRDGWVYSLRAADGALVWRFRAAPVEKRMVARDQVESPWPVHGAVLVRDDIVYCVAGRSMFLDGGMWMVRLDASTGELIDEIIMDDRVPGTESNLQTLNSGMNLPMTRPDILSCDGTNIYMGQQSFDLQGKRRELLRWSWGITDAIQKEAGAHLMSNVGMLDDSWFHRGYWIYGRVFSGGSGGWYWAGGNAAAGRILVHDGTKVYGFGRKPEYYGWSDPIEYRLYRADMDYTLESLTPGEFNNGYVVETTVATDWDKRNLPLLARAMAKAGNTLIVAGLPDLLDEEEWRRGNATAADIAAQDEAFHGTRGGILWTVNAENGNRIGELTLASPPSWDAMAVAYGRVYIADMAGNVVCLGDTTALSVGEREPVLMAAETEAPSGPPRAYAFTPEANGERDRHVPSANTPAAGQPDDGQKPIPPEPAGEPSTVRTPVVWAPLAVPAANEPAGHDTASSPEPGYEPVPAVPPAEESRESSPQYAMATAEESTPGSSGRAARSNNLAQPADGAEQVDGMLRVASVWAGSQRQPNSAGASIDGDRGTRWQPGTADSVWIVYDLGEPRVVSAMQLDWYAHRTVRVHLAVEVSLDGRDYERAVREELRGRRFGRTECDLRGARARFVRLSFRAAEGGIPGVCETRFVADGMDPKGDFYHEEHEGHEECLGFDK